MDADTGAMALAFAQTPVTSHNVSVVLMEDQTQGQLIGNFTLQCLLANGTARFGGASQRAHRLAPIDVHANCVHLV
jgi:hypothetical protein